MPLREFAFKTKTSEEGSDLRLIQESEVLIKKFDSQQSLGSTAPPPAGYAIYLGLNCLSCKAQIITLNFKGFKEI